MQQHDAGKPAFKRTRLPDLHGCSCCFPNTWRFLAQLPEYVFSTDATSIFVNLYTSATADATLGDGRRVKVKIGTGYPFDGEVEVVTDAPVTLKLRIPRWCEGAVVRQGERVFAATPGSYCTVESDPSQPTTITMPMPVRVLSSSSAAAENLGQVAFARGPIVYCCEIESGPQGLDIEKLRVRPDAKTEVAEQDGVPVIMTRMQEIIEPEETYFDANCLSYGSSHEVRMIPFYMRGNRPVATSWMTWIPVGGNE